MGTLLDDQVVDSWSHPESNVEITLPAGHTREHPELDREQPVGWDQVKRLPGIEDSSDVGEIIEEGQHLPGRGDYDLIIGDNPNGAGEIRLNLKNGLVISASQTVPDYTGKEVDVEQVINKILHQKDDWDHNQLGNSRQSIRENLGELVRNPDEVYGGLNPTNSESATIYVKEMTLNGNEVIVFAIVFGGKMVTSFVPTLGEGAAPSGSDYADVYDRDHAIQTIIEDVLEEYMSKIEEFDEIIEEIDEGESPSQ